jgi:methyltransferase
VNGAFVVVSLVAILRLVEIVYARHNESRLLADGGIEVGRGHYPLILLLHIAWLIVLAAASMRGAQIHWVWLGFFLLLQPLRAWTILSLGRFWTARVITLPTAPLVRRGPYRLIRHPNYLIVELEIVSLPLALGLWPTAVLFGLVNAALLAWRIKVEAAALSTRRAVPAG